MTRKEQSEYEKFTQLVRDISTMIDNFTIEVTGYSEMGIAHNILLKTFTTNMGQIVLTVKYNHKGYEDSYSVHFGEKFATAKVHNTDMGYDGVERMFEDIGEDLRSLFYETHVEKEDVEYEDMSGEEG